MPENTKNADRVGRAIALADGRCAKSPMLNETDEHIVAQLDGIRSMLGQIALCLAAIADERRY